MEQVSACGTASNNATGWGAASGVAFQVLARGRRMLRHCT